MTGECGWLWFPVGDGDMSFPGLIMVTGLATGGGGGGGYIPGLDVPGEK